ncbi:benzoylformate decarboxylase [Roseiarcus fermentans]|uniref:Benzoylformate decarboxylase n=1 Tax=Roseiarcus fermentans TaxID=1473586 RepID=A0A366FLJ8_9HYPH|nr:benzoylformate decarboxylase [Roseiarcus fermentans]RBP15564.1 benzoylformate decarboxylase [Roseiarcus fermentans]
MRTVREITFDLLRKLELTTIVGNPGSTEEPFLADFPSDFDYVLALQETSAVAVADGLSQSLRKPVLVNLHTGAGTGNAMGAIVSASLNKTPLIITAGQQTRQMLLIEPLLTNIDPTVLARPWVKWSYEPPRPEDVPAAFMRAYATAMQQPAGPVFLSLPMDDWEKRIPEVDVFRTVAVRQGPDPSRIRDFAARINSSENPVLVYGSDIARSQAWNAGIALAEKLDAPVWTAPFAERTPFPETHPLFKGALAPAIGPLSRQLAGHDLVLVVGAQVFRYYPFVPGAYLPEGAALLQITDDPSAAAKAAVGDSLISDAGLALEELNLRVGERTATRSAPQRAQPAEADRTARPMLPHAVLEVLRACTPDDFVLTEEAPSVVPDMQDVFRIDHEDCFYTFASGGLGWNLPAAVGLALGEIRSERNRPVVALMGDGSFQYSLQALYTAVRRKARLVVVVLDNQEYGILKEFAELEKTPNVPGLDLPGIDIVALGRGYGAESARVETLDELASAYSAALAFEGVTVLVVPITRKLKPLIG